MARPTSSRQPALGIEVGAVEAFYAGGNGGQHIIVIPELDLNIVIFAGNYNQRVMHKPKYEHVRDYVLKAVEAGG